MEAFSALLTLGAGNSPVTGEFPSQRASDAELFEQMIEQTIEMPVIGDAIALIVRLL